MKKVFVCSPYRGNVEENIKKAKQYAKYASLKGNAVFVPHLLYTQFLDDSIEQEREAGINSGLEFLKLCDEMWVFANDYDHCTTGMKQEIDACYQKPKSIMIKYIDPAECHL